MKKDSYPKRIYLSASWKADDRPLTVRMANLIANQGATVVRDHESNKNEDPVKAKRTWAKRIQMMIGDCAGLVVVMAHNPKCAQTSPYLIPEILAAAKQNIPILLFAHPSVSIQKNVGAAGIEFSFPNAAGQPLLDAKEILSKKPTEQSAMEQALADAGGFILPNNTKITGPLLYPNSADSHATENAVKDFVGDCASRDPYPYVFNVLPFSLKDSVHQTIATEVFKATGMACHISLDGITNEQSVRKNWERMLKDSDLVIAELSSLRDTCLFETGCAIGLDKEVYVVSRKGPQTLPFGLDDNSFFQYDSPEALSQHVREKCCRTHRREVFNLTDDFKAERGNDSFTPGLPDWLNRTSGFSLESRLTVSIWAISVSAAFAAQILAKLIWPDSPPPNPLAVFSLCTGFLALTRVGRENWEKRIGRFLSWVPWASLFSAVVLGAVLIAMVVHGNKHAPSHPPATDVKQVKSQ